jgi:hypothetical protein
MSFIVVASSEFSQVAAPNLPLAPDAYSTQYADQLNNVLRLYFNRLEGLTSKLLTGTAVIPPAGNYTVATLPSAVTSGVGARSFVTDALAPTFGSTVVTGGAVATPVYSDGTNWKVG